jgi:hypothetical protein
LHSSLANTNNNNISSNNNNSSNSNRSIGDESQSDEHSKLEIHDDHNSNASNTSLEVVNDSIGKSFTIAAILGLKNNTANALGLQSHDIDENSTVLNDYTTDFPNIINLSTHSKLFQKFENENRHNYMHHQHQHHHQHHHQQQQPHQQQSLEHSSQMPLEQCMYNDNNTTSNSSYQEHLHKQHINAEFNINYNRNVDEISQTNPTLRNHHLHSHPVLNKAFGRDRNNRAGKRI